MQHLQVNLLVFFTSKYGINLFAKEAIVHVKLLFENTATVHDITWMGSGKSSNVMSFMLHVMKLQFHAMKPFVKSENG